MGWWHLAWIIPLALVVALVGRIVWVAINPET